MGRNHVPIPTTRERKSPKRAKNIVVALVCPVETLMMTVVPVTRNVRMVANPANTPIRSPRIRTAILNVKVADVPKNPKKVNVIVLIPTVQVVGQSRNHQDQRNRRKAKGIHHPRRVLPKETNQRVLAKLP